MVSASENFLMTLQEKFNEPDGLRIYCFSSRPQKFTYMQEIAVERALKGNADKPKALVSMMKIQFSTFPGTMKYFTMMPKK